MIPVPKVFLTAMLLCTAAGPGAADEVLVFGAASLKEALEETVAAWEAQTGDRATISFAGSSALARQIQAGAPVDLFLSANAAWVDVLEREGLVRPGSRRDLLENDLVVIAHGAGAELDLEGVNSDTLLDRLGGGRLAMALVDAVPAGIYGKAALQSLGLWETVAPRVAQADNVRAALALVATGEAPLGVVYATDALAEPRVSVVATFPPGSHPPIRYPMIVSADSGHSAAAALATFLAGREAAETFRRHGFRMAEQAE